jgi:hypothetical protein
LIKRWSTICEAEDEEKSRRLAAASKQGKNYYTAPAQELTKLVTTVALPYYEELIEEMAALNPPTEDQAEVEKIIAKYEQTLKSTEGNPREMLFNDTFYKPNRMVKQYGVPNCTL